ncbi:response regulator [Tenacibaculum agarivorans]|uniref:response regulator n=1 Tax=Tenacibaculum agarivorans TaxID=1908389 RepID=UPI00094BB98B|nr:response regulator [Tenacibaculum agarivorans]
MIQDIIKILMVEDNPADAALIEIQIKKVVASPEIICVDTFQDFIIALEKSNPDIILCDYRLQGFNGFEILKYINTQAQHRIPLVFVTGTINDEELAANSILSGASGYILKNNMSVLHKKLLPHFEKVVGIHKNTPLDKEKRENIEQLQSYLDKVKHENAMNLDSYNEMRKMLDKLKGLLRE